MLGEAFPVSDGHRYVYQVHRLLENTSTSAPFRPFLQYLQNYSSCYVKLAFMFKKKEIYKKSTQNIMKHCPEICAKSWKSISLFFDTALKLLHWTQICKLLEFHPCPSESSCRISISSNLEALVTSQSYCIWFETEWKCAERKVWDLSWKWTTSSFMVLL